MVDKLYPVRGGEINLHTSRERVTDFWISGSLDLDLNDALTSQKTAHMLENHSKSHFGNFF
jgi:hypothetical protein